MEYQEVQGLGSRYLELLIWILNMDVGMPSAACSLISFDYYVSIALKHEKSEYSNRKEMTKVIKIQI